MCELSSAKRRAERMEAKVRKIKELMEKAEKNGEEVLRVSSFRVKVEILVQQGVN